MTENKWTAKAMGISPSEDDATSSPEEAVVLVQGLNVFAEKVYCYLKVSAKNFYVVRSKLENKEKFDLREYGEVIAAGQGDPTEEVREEMATQYNMLPFEKKTEESAKFDVKDVESPF